jgi:hypothetical protein
MCNVRKRGHMALRPRRRSLREATANLDFIPLFPTGFETAQRIPHPTLNTTSKPRQKAANVALNE